MNLLDRYKLKINGIPLVEIRRQLSEKPIERIDTKDGLSFYLPCIIDSYNLDGSKKKEKINKCANMCYYVKQRFGIDNSVSSCKICNEHAIDKCLRGQIFLIRRKTNE